MVRNPAPSQPGRSGSHRIPASVLPGVAAELGSKIIRNSWTRRRRAAKLQPGVENLPVLPIARLGHEGSEFGYFWIEIFSLRSVLDDFDDRMLYLAGAWIVSRLVISSWQMASRIPSTKASRLFGVPKIVR